MRQLAAILFADMTGYTALMQENEQLARTKRKRFKMVLEVAVAENNGRVVQYYGDGSLSIFNSAIDCVKCAISIQQQLQASPKVDLRIGIHTGDITMEEDSIYGDGVNLASRIESLAVPGGIFISEKVYDEIRNQDDILTRDLGYFELKNVIQPLRVFAVINKGVVVPDRSDIRGKTRNIENRLAVLPFVNMSADPENEYFSDGISEELLNALTRVEGLKVTSRTSAFAFKGKHHDIRDIGIQLNVDKILEGSVRKAGNRVRVTAQLINASDGYHIWSETYDRDLNDIFQVQDEISGIIANKLRQNLAPERQTHFKTKVTNVTAYTYYLKGLHFWNKMTPADSRKAIDCFNEAIAIQPDYALAYAISAAVYSYLGASGQVMPQKAFEIVRQRAEIALKLDDSIAESHQAMASLFLFYDWNWKAAYESLQKAIQLNPGSVDAYDLLGFYYVITGQKEKGVELLEEAEKLDPLSPVILNALGNMYIFAHRYDDAIRQADKVIEMNPSMRISIEMKGWATGMKGNWEEALVLFKEVHRLTNHPLKGLMGMAFSYGKLGDRANAMECIHKMEQRELLEPDVVVDADLAAAWASLGEIDKTIYYLHRCIDKRMGPVGYYLEYPVFGDLATDPRFREIRQRLGLEVIENVALTTGYGDTE
ncbi:MAG: adenylate/guanylate cyclase domain-containing protein [Flavisolibacter sp.]